MIKGLKICGISDPKTLNYILNHPNPPKFIGFITNYRKSKRLVNKAIEKVNNYGIYKIEQNIISKSKYFRKKLENFHQITFFENIDTLTGINTLKIKGISSLQIYTYLLSKRILCSITKSSSSLLYFKKLKVKDLLRISFHQYNSYDDINYLVKCLIDLIKKKGII